MSASGPDVPRETVAPDVAPEPEPAGAAEALGAGIDGVRRFTRALVAEGERRGLIGPREVERIWTRHILNSAVIAPLLPSGAAVADVGTGAGLPGIVLAVLRPDCRFVLIEPMQRRVDWLREQVDALGLESVEVEHVRAEDSAHLGRMDAVTARAVSALRTLLPIVVPLLRPGGELLLLKGAGVQGELAAAEKQVRRLRLTDVVVERRAPAESLEATHVFRARVGR